MYSNFLPTLTLVISQKKCVYAGYSFWIPTALALVYFSHIQYHSEISEPNRAKYLCISRYHPKKKTDISDYREMCRTGYAPSLMREKGSNVTIYVYLVLLYKRWW